MVDTSTTSTMVTKAVVARNWAQGAVPDTMTMFLEDLAADTTPPKPKASREKLFWKVGHGMD